MEFLDEGVEGRFFWTVTLVAERRERRFCERETERFNICGMRTQQTQHVNNLRALKR